MLIHLHLYVHMCVGFLTLSLNSLYLYIYLYILYIISNIISNQTESNIKFSYLLLLFFSLSLLCVCDNWCVTQSSIYKKNLLTVFFHIIYYIIELYNDDYHNSLPQLINPPTNSKIWNVSEYLKMNQIIIIISSGCYHKL